MDVPIAFCRCKRKMYQLENVSYLASGTDNKHNFGFLNKSLDHLTSPPCPFDRSYEFIVTIVDIEMLNCRPYLQNIVMNVSNEIFSYRPQ